MKKIIGFVVVSLVALVFSGRVSAHVTLSPKQAVVGYTTFTVNVPNEKDIPTTGVRVVVPDGVDVHGILPIPGWTHSEKREEVSDLKNEDHDDEHEGGRITEITWTGTLNKGEFMQFPVSVSYAGEPKDLVWKAYQTYSDGSVVPWDDTNEKNPAPKVTMMQTSAVEKLTTDVTALQKQSSTQSTSWLSVGAILLSAVALVVAMKQK